MTEKKVLNRPDAEISSIVGYAGGTRVGEKDAYGAVKPVTADPANPDLKPIVCYHNIPNKADYGALGHGEVVQVCPLYHLYPLHTLYMLYTPYTCSIQPL